MLSLDPELVDFGEVVSLGTTSPKFRIGIEFTMTHPLNKGWLNQLSKRQQKFYHDANCLFKIYLKETFDIKENEIYYEYHKNGQVHAHGLFVLETTKRFYTAGLLSDLGKIYLKQMPKKYSDFKDKYIKENPIRFFSPQININIFDNDVRKEWRTYIKKCQ